LRDVAAGFPQHGCVLDWVDAEALEENTFTDAVLVRQMAPRTERNHKIVRLARHCVEFVIFGARHADVRDMARRADLARKARQTCDEGKVLPRYFV
jgi:hypothetical protein